MDVITHTVIAMVCLGISYIVGYVMGERKGSIWGTAVALEWIERKVGSAQFNRWMREDEKSTS